MMGWLSYAPAFLQVNIQSLHLVLCTDCLQTNNLIEYLKQNAPGLRTGKSF